MKTRDKPIIKREVYTNCDKCGKEIKGTSESQVAFNLGIHKMSKECKNGNKN